MKKVHKSIYAITLFLYLLTSCTKEPFLDGGAIDGKSVRVTLSLSIPDPDVVQTRSTYENSIDDVYLLVFDGEGKFLESAQATEVGGAYQYITTLMPQSSQCSIYVVANASNVMGAQKGSWVSGITTLEEIKGQLLKTSLYDNGVGGMTIMPVKPPLVSKNPYESRIDAQMKIENIVLERATAKVVVRVNPGIAADFAVAGGNLCNVAVQGYVFGALNGSSIAVGNYMGEESGNYSVENMISAATDADPLYAYTTDASKQPFIIVKTNYKGVDGYYRIDLKDANSTPLSLERNHFYIVNIKSVTDYGYRSAAEAMVNAPLNTTGDVDIEVADSNSHDLVSNGAQFLGVSNSKVMLYQSGAVSAFEALRLSYTVAGGWQPGSVQVSVLQGASNSLSVRTANLPVSNTSDMPILVDMSDDFVKGSLIFRIGNLYKVVEIERYGELTGYQFPLHFEGYVMANKGNIQQNPYNGGGGEFAGNKWVRLADAATYQPDESGVTTPADRDRLTSAKGVYLFVEKMTGYNIGTFSRRGEVFLSKTNDDGRTKVAFTQTSFDVFANLTEIVPYTYVGTFHRRAEQGERIIRIAVDATQNMLNDRWQATVLVGGDWIRLSRTKSLDPGIGLHPYGRGDNPSWNTSALIEANTDTWGNPRSGVKDAYTGAAVGADHWGLSIEGKPMTPTEAGSQDINRGCVYFRVSVADQSKGSGWNENGVRYGVVALTHRKGTHLIFVRQGENDDYVMRPVDEVKSTYATQPDRPLARKYSPYNLTVKRGASSLSSPLTDWYDLGKNGYTMTMYPSQGGSYFMPFSTQAVNTKAKARSSNFPAATQASFNADAYETCPPGYRRPLDGPADVWQINALYGSTGAPYVRDSEFRQSLWLNPRNGYQQVATNRRVDNISRGYYADGFTDRRPIIYVENASVIANEDPRFTGITTNRPPATILGQCEVAGADSVFYNTAFAGNLIFNPTSFNSLFLPEPGYFNSGLVSFYGAAGTYSWRGYAGVYMAKTVDTSSYVWSAQLGALNRTDSGLDVADNASHYNQVPASVRCVKDN